MTWGQGPLLVIPPGWVSHLELQWHLLGMEPFYARLAESFRLLFYDRRGCGLSQRERHDFTLEAEVADLEVVIDAADVEDPVSLLGVSQAGPISIAYAAAHQDRIRRLVLFGAYDQGESLARPELRASLVSLVRASWGVATHALASIFVPAEDERFQASLARFQREAADRHMAAALLESGYELDVKQMLRDVRSPTLVIHRRDDRAVRSRFGVEIASTIPNARLVMLEGDIHFPWLGDWEPIADLVEDFVLEREAERVRPRAPPPPEPERPPPYRLVHYRVEPEPEQPCCRVALAQIGDAESLPTVGPTGLYRLPDAQVGHVVKKLTAAVERAAAEGAQLVLFPEMSIDLNHEPLEQLAGELCRRHGLALALGGYHDEATRMNLSIVLGPEGILWKQKKHIPAFLRSGGGLIEEPIKTPSSPVYVVGATHLGRIAVAVCRDFLDLELRVALRNSEPPVDLILNPAFTPVTADFRAAHFEARRALYACTMFCNFATFGESCIESPDKGARSVHLGRGEERVEVAEIPLFEMRAERGAWDARSRRRFIQSTRH